MTHQSPWQWRHRRALPPMRAVAAIMLAGVLGGLPAFADEFDLMRGEHLGALRIDLPEAAVQAALPCPVERGPEELWGADGAYHQQWDYPGCGVTLGMVSEKQGGSKSVDYVEVASPSDLSTAQGIHIGSTWEQVVAAYEFHWNREDSGPDSFIAGSIYGGLIFTFADGKVERIFLGAAAE